MRRPLLALLAAALAAGSACTAGTGATGACVASRSCATQGYQCGGFVDSCGEAQACGTCGVGACSTTDGTPGRCVIPGTFPPPGNPDGSCTQALPAAALPADTSSPTTVVGTGTAASCTFARLAEAVARGGVVTFDCGPEPVTLLVSSTLRLPTDRSTVIDGGGRVTLDGGHAVRILEWNSGNWQVNTNVLTLQHLALVNGKATPTEAIPSPRPPPCSQGWNDGQGGAVFMRDGVFRAIDVTFANNEAALLGPDTGGGAVYLLGTKPATIVRCSFLGNRASNAGGLGGLFATELVYDSLFDGNQATGHGANNDDATQCPDYMNAGQHQVGSGGNGGAMYSDGVGTDVTLCGVQIRNNHAGADAFGGAIFFTSNDASRKGTLSIRDSYLHDNTQGSPYWQWMPGISTNANTTAPVNSVIR